MSYFRTRGGIFFYPGGISPCLPYSNDRKMSEACWGSRKVSIFVSIYSLFQICMGKNNTFNGQPTAAPVSHTLHCMFWV